MFFASWDTFSMKDIIGPLIGGLMGWGAARYSTHAAEGLEQTRRDEAASAARDRRSVAYADDLSHRFKVLMDGYEGRIRDLTEEVALLRGTVEQLSRELNEWTATCATCPHRQHLSRRYTVIDGGHDGTD